tara:strand:+ start:6 stop:2027 length:2022 start_codon:yes stop_codon:yes gene_type:complete
MILSIYNFKLYYPTHGASETPSEEEGERGERTEDDSSGTTEDEAAYAAEYGVSVEEAKDRLQSVNKTGGASWTKASTSTYDFDTPQGVGPVTNTKVDIEKRAESRGNTLKRKKRIFDYGDEKDYEDPVIEEKRKILDRNTYGKSTPTKSKNKINKLINSYSIQGVDHGKIRPIKQVGETRKIELSGTPGSIFTITIKDSEGCSILDRDLNNISIPRTGKFILKQKFPSIVSSEGVSRSQQYYNVELTVSPDVYVSNSVQKITTIYQYKDPTVTFSKTYDTSGDLPTLTLAGNDISVSGTVNEKSSIKKTYELTIQDSSTATRLYVKNNGFKGNLVTNTSFEAKVDKCGKEGPALIYDFEILTTKNTVVDSVVSRDINATITSGMQLTCNIIKDRDVVALLDKDSNIIQTGSCSDKKINKLSLTHTDGLSVGMLVDFNNGDISSISSIDCDKNITLTDFHELDCDATLTFITTHRAKVFKVDNVLNNKVKVLLDRSIDLPHGSIVTFDNNYTILRGNARISGSGNTGADAANQLKLKAQLDVKQFGFNDITYSFDLDKMLSIKPNAYDQNITISKDSSGFAIKMIKYDKDTNRTGKTGVVVKPPSHGVLSAYNASNDTFTYTPNPGYSGKDFFTFQMKDDANTLSDVKKVCIKVLGQPNPNQDVLPRFNDELYY